MKLMDFYVDEKVEKAIKLLAQYVPSTLKTKKIDSTDLM